MPMLDDARVKDALLHPDAEVRGHVLRVLADQFSPDTSFMPAAIEAVRKHGRKHSFPYHHHLSRLAQTPETIRWVVGEVTAPAPDADIFYRRALAGLLADAPPELVAPHQAALAEIAAFPHHQESIHRRIRLAGLDDDTLWREMEVIVHEAGDPDFEGEPRWREADDIAGVLGLRGGRNAPRVLEVLAREPGADSDGMETLAARMAGLMRLEAAVPRLVAWLHDEDGDVMMEQSETALIRIGGDISVAALASNYGAGASSFRLACAVVWGGIRSEAALQATLDWLGKEPDRGLIDWLACSATSKLSPEANEAVLALYRKHGVLRESRDGFVASCTLLGQDFPELHRWRGEAKADARRVARSIAAAEELPRLTGRVAPLPDPAEKPKAGRNDPCPCGSGKKFKKCCLK